MSDGIYAAMSGAMSRAMALDVVANNVANAPTPGFRADAVAFREQPAEPRREPGEPTASIEPDIRVATVDAVVPSLRPGPIEETGGAFDVAIEGDGMLSVSAPGGVRYTRGGTLIRDAEGNLATAEGYPVLDVEGRPVRLPLEGEPVIGDDGTVTVGDQSCGRMAVVWFDRPNLLSREGGNLYMAAAGTQVTEASGVIRQGAIEGANIDVVRGMIDLVSLTRSYEATIRAMENFRNIDQRTVRDLARG